MPQKSSAKPGPRKTIASGRLLILLLALPVIAALGSVWALDHAKTHRSLLAMTNLVGPTTRSLLADNGLSVCTEDMGARGNPICFHAAQMPATALTIALGIRLFGDRYLIVAVFKTLLLLLSIKLAIWLVWGWLPRVTYKEARRGATPTRAVFHRAFPCRCLEHAGRRRLFVQLSRSRRLASLLSKN